MNNALGMGSIGSLFLSICRDSHLVTPPGIPKFRFPRHVVTARTDERLLKTIAWTVRPVFNYS
jgi:hypothetical protein